MSTLQSIEQEILANDEGLDGHPHKVPLEINESVRKWIHHFTVTDRARFQRFLQRGSQYKTLVQETLKKNGVPGELYYLAMIESGYSTHARSHARAVGPWQFIRGTGLRYGLQQNHYLDERKDILRSTTAAANYLKDLYTVFQSWYLAMAGYNAGEGRILGAIIRGNSRDFWELVEKKALPPETRNYVPKVLAATIIGKNPERFGFRVEELPPFPEVESADVWGGVPLSSVAKEIDVPLQTLKRINPQLTRSVTPPHIKNCSIWVPQGKADLVQEALPTLARNRLKLKTRAVASRSTRRHRVVHRVRRGEALSLISQRYGVSLSKIKQANRLRTNRIYVGQNLFIPRLPQNL